MNLKQYFFLQNELVNFGQAYNKFRFLTRVIILLGLTLILSTVFNPAASAPGENVDVRQAGYIYAGDLGITPPETTLGAALVQTIDTSLFDPPIPDPTGITYLPYSNNLLISDSEVNEIPDLFTGDNLFEMTLTGNLLDTYNTISYSSEPTGVDYNPVNGHLFISDDNREKIFELAPGPDGILFTPDDSVTSFSTTLFGSNDPEGVAFDSRRGVLFIVDGDNEEVYQVDPGINGVFDGVAPFGDDQVNNFDTTSIGITNPEGIAFNPENGLLYIVGTPKGSLAEVSISGTLIQMIDISTPLSLRSPDGLSFAPGSQDPSALNIYITDRGVDNNIDPDENDGKVYEMSFPFTILPEVQSVSPSDGALGVVVTTPLVITFTQVVNTSTFTYTLAPDPGDWVETWSTGDTVVTLNHNAFTGDTVYTVSVTAADDLAGNPLGWAPVTWNFTTTDANPPEVQSVSPSDGALGVVVTTPLVITFSEAMNTGTFTYTLAPDPGDWVETWSAGDTVVTLNHNAFTGDTVYTVSVTAADDLAGNPLGWAPVTWNFTTTDANPPEVQSVSPSDGALGVVVTTPLVITFSEAMNTGTFTYTLAPDPGDWVETWSAGDTVVTLNHNAFTGDTVYSVSVTAADDLAGNPLSKAPVTWNFTTKWYSIYLPITSKVLTPAP